MTIDVEHLLAAVVVVRGGSADVRTMTRRPLSTGVRISTQEQLSRRTTGGAVRITYGENPPEIEGPRA